MATPHVFLPLKTHHWVPRHAPVEGQVVTVGDSTGDFRELGHSVSVQCSYHDFLFIYFPFSLLYFMLSIFVHNLCYVVVFGVGLSIDYIHS